jgi:hypothetical protein
MRVALVFPPQGHFTQPYLSLPSLAAFLRANGVDDVHTIDASIESYDYFLSRARLTQSLERIDARAGLAQLEARDTLSFSAMERYQVLSEISLIAATSSAPTSAPRLISTRFTPPPRASSPRKMPKPPSAFVS